MTNKYIHKQNYILESGESLPGFELTYTTSGQLNATKSNVVWICHALTGNANAESWWPGLVGNGHYYDPAKYFIVGVNVIGSCYGSTGPLSTNPIAGKPYYHAFPHITIRDIVGTLDVLRQHLQLPTIDVLIGGSLGGQQAVEWAISKPEVIKNLVLVATNAKHSPWGIAFNESQRLAIAADSTWKQNNSKAGEKGLVAARSIALLSYRNYQTYQKTQTDNNEKTDNYNASSYQRYQGQKFINRFNAFSYWTLSKAMDSHDVSRGRGSLSNALSTITAQTTIIAIQSDILFPLSESEVLAKHIPNNKLHVIDSTYGHDGFLIETNQITAILSQQENNYQTFQADKLKQTIA